MRTRSLQVDLDTDGETLAALWAQRLDEIHKPHAPRQVAPKGACKALGCERDAVTMAGWCNACRQRLAKLGLPADVNPVAFAEAWHARSVEQARHEPAPPAGDSGAPLDVEAGSPVRVVDAYEGRVDRLRDDLRKLLGMDDGASDGEIIGAVSGLVASVSQHSNAAGELARLAEKHADTATVMMAERDGLAERLVAAEAQLALLSAPMTEEEIAARADALTRAALTREWALMRAPRTMGADEYASGLEARINRRA